MRARSEERKGPGEETSRASRAFVGAFRRILKSRNNRDSQESHAPGDSAEFSLGAFGERNRRIEDGEKRRGQFPPTLHAQSRNASFPEMHVRNFSLPPVPPSSAAPETRGEPVTLRGTGNVLREVLARHE
ncbi:hypothetical protein KM043_014507 [Ampulex compressa]|nr:hypothetical protein KM043_014507 [Ampulex compressa]